MNEHDNHKNKKARVMVFGTFDVLHPGHIFLFKEASKLGELYVVIARDKTVQQIKGFAPSMNEEQRRKKVQILKHVKKAVLGKLYDKFKIVEEISPDIICLGYDQKTFADRLPEELKKRGMSCEIRRIPPYKAHRYKSSLLKY